MGNFTLVLHYRVEENFLQFLYVAACGSREIYPIYTTSMTYIVFLPPLKELAGSQISIPINRHCTIRQSRKVNFCIRFLVLYSST